MRIARQTDVELKLSRDTRATAAGISESMLPNEGR